MNCIIIDDNEISIKTLSNLLVHYCPQVNILGFSQTINDALPLINKLNPEIVFLDVEMNGETGFDLLDFYPNPKFKIVFTTAHEKYALPAIKANCYDFLLKPIDIKELNSCIAKITNHKNSLNENTSEQLIQKKIAFITPSGFSFMEDNEVVFFKADGKYTQITTCKKEKYTSSKSLGEIEPTLSAVFFRSHKSIIINLNYVTSFNKTENIVTLLNEIDLEISVRKKEEFMQKFNRM